MIGAEMKCFEIDQAMATCAMLMPLTFAIVAILSLTVAIHGNFSGSPTAYRETLPQS